MQFFCNQVILLPVPIFYTIKLYFPFFETRDIPSFLDGDIIFIDIFQRHFLLKFWISKVVIFFRGIKNGIYSVIVCRERVEYVLFYLKWNM